jgi:methanol--5-hydroxybenzimidazolylcobamide Co-methyltransferase
MTRFELGALKDATDALGALTDDSDQFVSDCLETYKREVKVFRTSNYDL